MIHPPYFTSIHANAARRWQQLEQDPELAAPWHQLFKQVQSPRHVLSELLQNADDAGATIASVAIQADEFVFTHNGEDFTEEHFASLCRFGYSNKRSLHTIGFRGIGFKSTFSLGDEVKLFTPTLAVAFRKARFTEPIWLGQKQPTTQQTEIRVRIKDQHRQRELEKNLAEWLNSPVSLLFFRSIRCLRINAQEVRWVFKAAGPIADSAWMNLSTAPDKPYLLIHSPLAPFPPAAIEEIRQERMVSEEDAATFPPCRIEIVLGNEGRLFVILPTGVKTELPFACNAPFIQDPARVKLKDPETSPTNRWLLQRTGELAAHSMLAWLNQSQSNNTDRSTAYQLFPDVDRNDDSLEGSCATWVEQAFEDEIGDQAFLLTEQGELVAWKTAAIVPETLLAIWPSDQVAEFFLKDEMAILNGHVAPANRQKLLNWKCVTELTKATVLQVLTANRLVKPQTWAQLLALWFYIAEDIRPSSYYVNNRAVCIFPIQGSDLLHAASEIVRLGESKLLQSADDWKFLANHLLVLNPNWTRFLAEQRRTAEAQKYEQLGQQVETAYRVLQTLELHEATDANKVLQQVATEFFSAEKLQLVDCVRLAQIAAALQANVTEDFKFVTCNLHLKSIDTAITADLDGELEQYVAPEWYKANVLHAAYHSSFTSCTKADWDKWINSGRSRLYTFIPLVTTQQRIWRRDQLLELLRQRSVIGYPSFPYVTQDFIFDDIDFAEEHWHHWQLRAASAPQFWGRLLELLLRQPQNYFSKAQSASVVQVATTGSRAYITQEHIVPAWLIKFRTLPCLPDIYGRYHQPAELLCRTPSTESLLGVEPFVRAELDTEANRPMLIKLGVRNTPTGPEQLLERLRSLAGVPNAPITEIQKWYTRLDQLFGSCSTQAVQQIKDAFAHEKLILTNSKEWAQVQGVFITANEEDAPGAALIHPAVADLTLWVRIGVVDRPTADHAINWLKGFATRQALAPDEARRVRALLARYPTQIWHTCGHWLNLQGEWVPTADLAYALTMQSLIAWKQLFQAIKQTVADLQMLSAEITQQPPFAALPLLANRIEDRFLEPPHDLFEPKTEAWLIVLGQELCRIILPDEAETARIRALAQRLARTRWQVSAKLETIPYLAGTPAGTAQSVPAIWKAERLYVENRSAAQLAAAVSQMLSRSFERAELNNVFHTCYDRSAEFITDYLTTNFRLAPPIATPPPLATTQSNGQTAMPAANPPPVASLPIPADQGHLVVNEQNLSATLPLATNITSTVPLPMTPPTAPTTSDNDNADAPAPRRPHPTLPAQPSLIERFARAKGYIKIDQDRYRHPKAGLLVRAADSPFPWQRLSANGDLLQAYWPKEHCLQREPLALDAAIWELCRQVPDQYALLLIDLSGLPQVISGRQLQAMNEQNELILYPATYRLEIQHGPKS